MKKEIITRPLSGFMELKPAEQILFNKIKAVIEKNYRLFGFIPMDNPLIERKETLFANVGGETQKEIYQFKKGDEEIALRFDLTVPLARYVADKYGELTFPFKRYQIAKVYRGERPQAGRFREFYQADIDVIGDGELSLDYDSEVIVAVIKIFQDLNLDATIRINNRKIFNGIFDYLKIDEAKRDEILIFIDKWEKIGEEKVEEGILNLGVDEEKVQKLKEILKIQRLEELEKLEIRNEAFEAGLKELKEVFENLASFGFDEKKYQLDLIIVRGLAYYTGTIYETRLNQNPEFGSVCSGGRYENLASAYTDKKLPGVGISIGLSRLFDLLLKNNLIEKEEKTYTKFLILPMTDDKKTTLELAQKLRNENIPTEINFDFDKKLGKRIRYADKLGIPFVILIGEDEIKDGFYTVKNLETGEQERVENVSELVFKIKNDIGIVLKKIVEVSDLNFKVNNWTKTEKAGVEYLNEVKLETDETIEEYKENNKVFLEDEYGDILWDWLQSVRIAERDQKIDSLVNVLKHSYKKYFERISVLDTEEYREFIKNNSGRDVPECWDRIKKKQKEELKMRDEELKK